MSKRIIVICVIRALTIGAQAQQDEAVAYRKGG